MATHPLSTSDADALVIIPTYNEAENIQVVLHEVLTLPDRLSVLVVDDGSPDGTAGLVEQIGELYPGRVHLLERAGKQGLGTAYILGFRYALERGFTYICEMDADHSHDPQDLPRLLAPLRTGAADVVVGSRYIGGVRVMNWPLSRLILSYGASIYTRFITRLPVFDVTAGFKAFHRRVLETVTLEQVRSNGYSFQIEMNYRAWKRGFRVMEIPIVFTERTEGQSKMSRAIVREAAFKVWQLRLMAMLGRL